MYLAIDIETTGLNPHQDQILEIAAVKDVPGTPVIECPTFEAVIHQDPIIGTPQALAMNARLIQEIAEGRGQKVENVADDFLDFLDACPYEDARCYTPLGKNVGSFDLAFLKAEVEFEWLLKLFHYRCLDVGSLYAKRSGMSGQSELCDSVAKRHRILGNPHEALYDAQVSLALARDKWSTL
jgi:oligoribonuclease (3'-5' exoribonuclease)